MTDSPIPQSRWETLEILWLDLIKPLETMNSSYVDPWWPVMMDDDSWWLSYTCRNHYKEHGQVADDLFAPENSDGLRRLTKGSSKCEWKFEITVITTTGRLSQIFDFGPWPRWPKYWQTISTLGFLKDLLWWNIEFVHRVGTRRIYIKSLEHLYTTQNLQKKIANTPCDGAGKITEMRPGQCGASKSHGAFPELPVCVLDGPTFVFPNIDNPYLMPQRNSGSTFLEWKTFLEICLVVD